MSSGQLQLERPDDGDQEQERRPGQIRDHLEYSNSNLEQQKQHQQGQGRRTLLLPALESSPYLKYTDLEDYKRKAYGSSELGLGHLYQPHPKPKPPHHHHHHHVGTDAPTPDAAAAASSIYYISEQQAAATIDRKLK